MKKVFIFIAAAYLLLSIRPADVRCGDWSVSPISLDLGRDAKSGVITVANDAQEKLNVQIQAMEWSQDAEGKDLYTDTQDIIFFPKIMTLDKKEDRIIRVGMRTPAIAREKTYRLFIEEIPETGKAAGANVAIAVKFGVPVFVKPLKEEIKGEISAISLAKGVLTAAVRNTGTIHFRITSITATGRNGRGEQTFATELAGWYLLSGVSRSYSATIARDACMNTATIHVEIKTDKITLPGNLDVDKAMCSP